MSQISKLIVVSENDKSQIREHYGKSEEDIQKEVSELKIWLGNQEHLPQNIGEFCSIALLLKRSPA